MQNPLRTTQNATEQKLSFKRKALAAAIIGLSAGIADARIEEVIVTSTKQAASTQDIPVAVTALNSKALDQLGIANFDDYLAQMPGVTAGGAGPGQNTIYIRGVASTTPNLTTAGVAGLAPNVAFYLDEQPLAQPGRNLDVYAADLARIEVLKGPQGTLFGASSQAGTVRLITNKPDLSENYGSLDLGLSATKSGDPSNNFELMGNLVVNENIAVRGVVYRDNKGGYIDNVLGDSLNASQSARFRTEGTVRSNGVPVRGSRAGIQAGADLGAVDFINADNSDLVEENFNESTYTGGRLSAKALMGDNWELLLGYAGQKLDTEGVFFADPELGEDELAVQRYAPEATEDSYDNASWTLTGQLKSLELVYTGAFTSRETEQLIDYTDYIFIGPYVPYYICDSSVSYPGDAAPTGTCYSPELFVDSETNVDVNTHELRVSTNQGSRLRATFGAFYSDLELAELNNFTYPGSTQADVFGSIGFSDNFAFDTGYTSQPINQPFADGVIFRNDVLRTDEQFGVFGEATFDISQAWSVTVGARYYDIEVDFEGSANSSFCNSFQADANAFGTDISDLYNGDGEVTFRGSCNTDLHLTVNRGDTFEQLRTRFDAVDPGAVSDGQINQLLNAVEAPDKAVADGVIGKLTLNWRPNSDLLFYGTLSEGFRPGLLNRPGGANGPGTYVVPFELATDDVTNLEFGWKTDLMGGDLRLNGSIFHVQIESLQTTIFDPSITNLFFSDNAADAEVSGLEADFIYAPTSVLGLTVSGAVSVLDTEITEVLTPTNDVQVGDSLAFAPELQATLRARYEWPLGNFTASVMPHLSYSDESFTDIISINRIQLDSWMQLGFTAGISQEDWSFEFFADNITDERAQVSGNYVFDQERISYARPLTAGFRLSRDF